MKAFIFACWGTMIVALIAVLAAGHMAPAGFIALAGGMACLAGVFLIFYQAMHRIGFDRNDTLEGKPVTLIFVLVGASLLLLILSSAVG
jgi:uncharacterized membrane protein